MEIFIAVIVTFIITSFIFILILRREITQKNMDYIAKILDLPYETKNLACTENYREMRKQLQRELYDMMKRWSPCIPCCYTDLFSHVWTGLVQHDKIRLDAETILQIVHVTGHEIHIVNKRTGNIDVII